jgi:hypothetical protein
MPNLNPFKRTRNQPMTELSASIANGVSQVMAGRQSSDIQQQRELAENAMIINDPEVDSLFQGMSRFTWTDTEGVMGTAGKEYTGATPKFVAAAILNSHLFRVGWVDAKDARVLILQAHSLILRIKMKLTEEEYEEGGAIVMDSAYAIIKMNILGSVNGRIAKLVKSRPHSFDVTVGQGPFGEGAAK